VNDEVHNRLQYWRAQLKCDHLFVTFASNECLAKRLVKKEFNERLVYWRNAFDTDQQFVTFMANKSLAKRLEIKKFHERLVFWRTELKCDKRFVTFVTGDGVSSRLEDDKFHSLLKDVKEMAGDKRVRSFVAIVAQLGTRLIVLGIPFMKFYYSNNGWVQKHSKKLKQQVLNHYN
jgi:hypothetical protein